MRFRLSTRHWMCIVLAVAVVMASVVAILALKRKSDRYRARADLYSQIEHRARESEKVSRNYSQYHRRSADGFSELSAHRADLKPSISAHEREAMEGYEDAERAMRRGDHAARMREKYLRAAAKPWKFVPPDPPLPE